MVVSFHATEQGVYNEMPQSLTLPGETEQVTIPMKRVPLPWPRRFLQLSASVTQNRT
jgi:hypothetical protein